MDNKIAVVAVIISDFSATEKVNSIFSDYRDFIKGRLGLPYKERSVAVISVIMDAPMEVINGLSGKIGNIEGVSCKVLTTK